MRLMIGQIGGLVQRNQQRASRKCLDRHSAAAPSVGCRCPNLDRRTTTYRALGPTNRQQILFT